MAEMVPQLFLTWLVFYLCKRLWCLTILTKTNQTTNFYTSFVFFLLLSLLFLLLFYIFIIIIIVINTWNDVTF